MRAAHLTLTALLGAVACADGAEDLVPAVCGDGQRTGVEVCDGPDLGDGSCPHYGFPAGELVCNPNCNGHLVGACEGLPDFRDFGPDPCSVCLEGEVCRGLECVPTSAPHLTLPDTLTWRTREVRITLDPSGLDPEVRRGVLYLRGQGRGRSWSRPLNLSRTTSLAVSLEDDLYVATWAPDRLEAQAWRADPEEISEARASLRVAPTLHRVEVTVPEPEDRPVRFGTLRWRHLGDPPEVAPDRPAWAQAELQNPELEGPGLQTVWLNTGRHVVSYTGGLLEPNWGLSVPGPGRRPGEVVVAGPRSVQLPIPTRRLDVKLELAPGAGPGPFQHRIGVFAEDYPGLGPAPLRVDPSGEAALWLPVGRYSFELGGVRSPTFDAEAGRVEWSAGLRETTVRIVSAPAGAKVDAVLLRTGSPAQTWTLNRVGEVYRGLAPADQAQVFLRLEDRVTFWHAGSLPEPGDSVEVRWPDVAEMQGSLTLDGDSAEVEGARVHLRSSVDPSFVAASGTVDAEGAFVLRAPLGSYEVWLDAYRLHPDFDFPGAAPRAFDAKRVTLRVSVPAGGSNSVQLLGFSGRGPGSGPALGPEGARTYYERELGPAPWSISVWPGRYRVTYLAEGHTPRARLLDAERAVELFADEALSFTGAPEAVRVRVPDAPDGAALVFESPIWSRRLPLERGVAEGRVRPGFTRVVLETPDGARVQLAPTP